MIFLQKIQLHKRTFQSIKNSEKASTSVRVGILQVVFAALLVLLFCRLWDLQSVNGEKYVPEQSGTRIRGARYMTVTVRFWRIMSWLTRLR